MLPELRPYQLDALDAIDKAAAAGQRRALLVLPTGTGKTVVFAEAIRRRGGRALVVAHRDELLTQAANKLVSAGIGRANIGLVKADSNEVTAPVVLASVQTVARKVRRARLLDAQAEAGLFATVVIDEAHHSPAPSYKALLADLDNWLDDDAEAPFVLGVTATPGRKGVAELFGEPIYSQDLVDMIAEGWLCDLVGRRVGINLDLGAVPITAGDYDETALAAALADADAPEAVAAAWAKHGEDRPTLVFTASVALAHATAAALCAKGAKAEALDGTTPTEERRAMLARYREGHTQVIVNCAVLTEGVDLPGTACVVVARPTRSQLFYAQQIGRGTRLAPGKDNCLVLDLVGVSERYNLAHLGPVPASSDAVSLGSLVGLDLDDDTSLLRTALDDKQRRAQLEALLAQHGRLLAKDIDLFGRQALRWLRLDGEMYFLGLGHAGRVALVLDSHIDEESTCALYHLPLDGPLVVLGTELRIEQATALAEQLAWRRGAVHLASSSAPWRRGRASEKQVEALRRWRVPGADVAGVLTKGQASDLLAAAVAARQLRHLVGRPRYSWSRRVMA
jgi:ATP-dependent helicase IRC3